MDCVVTRRPLHHPRVDRASRMHAALMTHPLFAPCDYDIRQGLLDQARIVQFKRGDMILHRGSSAQHVFCVLQGSVQLVALDADGRERVIDLYMEDDLFGEINLLLDTRHRNWAQANLLTRLLRIPRSSFLTALERDRELSRRTMVEVSRRAEKLMDRICTTATPRGVLRVVSYLADLTDDAGNTQTVTLPAAKRTIASMLNLTHESFSRLLRQLSEQGLIDVRGRGVHIPDVQRLLATEHVRHDF